LAAELHGARVLAAMGRLGEAEWSLRSVRDAIAWGAIRTAAKKRTGLECSFCAIRQKTKDGQVTEAAKLTIRGDRLGRDVRSLDIEEPGWWTLGISFSDDGQVHYYAHAGVADLTAEDHLMSSYPYGERCTHDEQFLFQRRQHGQWAHVEHALGD
jgi:hypothetical protein